MSEDSRTSTYVIVKGNIERGFELIGPFDTSDKVAKLHMDMIHETLLEDSYGEETHESVPVYDPSNLLPVEEAIQAASERGELQYYGLEGSSAPEPFAGTGSLFDEDQFPESSGDSQDDEGEDEDEGSLSDLLSRIHETPE